MARIKGIDLPKNKRGDIGLTYIYGIGRSFAKAILAKATTPELKAIAIKEGFRTMQDMGQDLLLSGDLSYAEYERVLQSS